MEAHRARVPPGLVNLVVYHGGCSDGTAAAACAYLALGSKARYIGTNPLLGGQVDANVLSALNQDTNLLVLDFSWSREAIQHIEDRDLWRWQQRA